MTDRRDHGTTLTDVYSALARVVLVDRELEDVLTEITEIALQAVPAPRRPPSR